MGPQFWKSGGTQKKGQFWGGKKFCARPKKKVMLGNGYAMCFLQKKWKKSVKFGLGKRSNISLPHIGGSHPVPSLSRETGYSNVLPQPQRDTWSTFSFSCLALSLRGKNINVQKNILLTTNIDFKTATAIATLNADGSQGSDAASDNGFFSLNRITLTAPPTYLWVHCTSKSIIIIKIIIIIKSISLSC